ncbi:MAG: hypothetical protein ABIG93_04505 [archaeon]|nr:hypothetical protein [Nanoarchaeota archaeon]
MKRKSWLKIVFWAFLIVFIAITLEMVFEWLMGPFFIPSILIFFLLGIVMLVLTFRENTKGWLKKFLILMSSSAVLFFISVVLHNAYYAFGTLTECIVLTTWLGILEVAFFLIAVISCPIAFVVGLVGSIIFLFRKK